MPSGSAIRLADNTIRKVMKMIPPADFQKQMGLAHPRMEPGGLARDRVRDKVTLGLRKGMILLPFWQRQCLASLSLAHERRGFGTGPQKRCMSVMFSVSWKKKKQSSRYNVTAIFAMVRRQSGWNRTGNAIRISRAMLQEGDDDLEQDYNRVTGIHKVRDHTAY